MDDTQARKILSDLANGVHPDTGEPIEIDTPFQALDVIRALFVAIASLDRTSRLKTRGNRSRMPAKAGKPWTDQEDVLLLERFDAGQNLQQLAEAHERTLAGIQARLERHGRVQGQGLQWRGRAGAKASDAV